MLFNAKLSTAQREELDRRFEKLERDFKALELEWCNAYDKLLTMMQRVAKRAEAIDKATDVVGTIEHGVQLPTIAGGRGAALQQQILARRSRLQNGGE